MLATVSELAYPSLAAAASAPQLPEWVPEQVSHVWGLIRGYPLLEAAVIIVGAFLIAKLADVVITRVVVRLTRRTKTELDDRIIARLHRPTFLTIFFAGLVWATHVLGLPATLIRITTGMIWTLLVMVWFRTGFLTCRLVLDALARQRDRFRLIESRTIPLLDMTAKLVLAGGAVYVFLLIWRIDPTAWLASAGIIGIAVGFAAKDTLANLFSGFFIIADSPYKIGDFIILDTGERGRVTQIGLRSTRLLTRDDIEITLPNAVIGNAKIINESGGPYEKERIRVKVGVAYGSDVDQVCEVLERLAVAHEHICADPAPRARLRQFGDSGINFELLAWIDEPVLRGQLSHQLHMEIYKEFGRLGIEIPFPKRDVYIRQMPHSHDDAS
jgi:small-conductance mechanosensitive channel